MSLEEVKQLEIRPRLCRISALTAVGVHFWDHSHTFCCMSSALVRRSCSKHCALVPHLHLPTVRTTSCVLPWTSLSPHLVPPVWQETTRQLTRPAHLQPLMHSYPRKLELVLTMNYSFCYTSARVLLWPTVTPILTPHFITLFSPMGSSASRA